MNLPAGAVSPYQFEQTIEMYYGNPLLGTDAMENEYNDPESVFFMYEGFEAPFLEQSIFKAGGPCTEVEKEDREPHGFMVTDQLPYAGERSLYSGWGTMGVLIARSPMPVKDFKMRAWFYDSDATNSSHYISPDFDACEVTPEDKPLIPEAMGPLEAVSTAVGTYTLAHTTKFCVASPWESTEERSAGWHLFEVMSVKGRTVVTIDNKVVKDVTSDVFQTTLDKVMISAGFGVDGVLHPGLNENHAFWDEISVAVVEPGVEPAMVSSMEEDEPVANTEGRAWYKVNVTGAPPPRYAHSAVVYEDHMYIFGGERSAYAFNDVWAYSFKEMKWTFITPKSGHIPSPRYDHSAAVTAEGMMVIYGGRNSMQLLGDMWAFDLKQHVWTRLAEESVAGARFGHTAAVPKGSPNMYLFGGYAEEGFSRSFVQCHIPSGKCVDITHGCQFPEVGALGPDRAGFLPESLTARYEHTSFADDRFVYVYGGASIDETYGFGGVYKFAVHECAWEEVPTSTAPPVRRYEHVAALLDGGFVVHGGHAGGDFFDDTYFFPL